MTHFVQFVFSYIAIGVILALLWNLIVPAWRRLSAGEVTAFVLVYPLILVIAPLAWIGVLVEWITNSGRS